MWGFKQKYGAEIYMQIISIDMKNIVDGAMNGVEIEKRVKDLLEEVRESKGGVILFIDDLHNFVKDDGLANILKFALARGDFKELQGWRNIGGTSKGMRDMFETIQVREPSREDTIQILNDMVHKYETHHVVRYTQTALVSAVDLSKHYMRELVHPGKAIDLIDRAGARASMLGLLNVTEVEIEHVVSMSLGVRLSQVFTEEEATSLVQLEDGVKQSIIGQDEVVAAVCGSIKKACLGMRDETKPIGCFLFAGPTGVGKTEMAKVLAKEYFGSEAAMVRLDTRKFMENHTVSRLVDRLVEEVRQKPHCLVLFDEIEKGHEEALNVVHQISTSGRLSDLEGKSIDFKDTIVVVISNAESHSYKAEVVNGFDQVVVFKPLEKEHMAKIFKITIKQFGSRVLARSKVKVKISKNMKKWLLSVGYDKAYGARALKRAFATSVEAKLADEILHGRVAPHDTVRLDITLTGDVECETSRVKISRKSQDPESDEQLLVTEYATMSKDDKGRRRRSKMTIGGVDSELVLPLFNKHLLQNPPRKNYSGRLVEGVEAEAALRIIKSFYDFN